MRILILSHSAYPAIGGVENSIRFFARELLKLNHEVKILCLQSSVDLPLKSEYDGVEIIRIPFPHMRWPQTRLLNIVRYTEQAIPLVLKHFPPDIVWSRSPGLGLGLIRAGYHGPLLYILPTTAKMDTDSLLLKTKGLPNYRRLLLLSLWPLQYFTAFMIESRLLNYAKPIVFSENMRRSILNSYGKKIYNKTVKIYPGVDIHEFSPEHGKTLIPQIESKYGIYKHDSNILFVGRFSTSKNLYSLIDALSLIKSRSRLILVGSGLEEERIRSFVSMRNLVTKVFFVGQQSTLLPGFYAIAKVFVNPSLIESFGQTMLEAQACGIPVVAYGNNPKEFLTATDEIILDGRTGFIVRKKGPSALAEKIESLLSLSHQQYASMSLSARNNVSQRFTWGKFVENVLMLSTGHFPLYQPESVRLQ